MNEQISRPPTPPSHAYCKTTLDSEEKKSIRALHFSSDLRFDRSSDDYIGNVKPEQYTYSGAPSSESSLQEPNRKQSNRQRQAGENKCGLTLDSAQSEDISDPIDFNEQWYIQQLVERDQTIKQLRTEKEHWCNEYSKILDYIQKSSQLSANQSEPGEALNYDQPNDRPIDQTGSAASTRYGAYNPQFYGSVASMSTAATLMMTSTLLSSRVSTNYSTHIPSSSLQQAMDEEPNRFQAVKTELVRFIFDKTSTLQIMSNGHLHNCWQDIDNKKVKYKAKYIYKERITVEQLREQFNQHNKLFEADTQNKHVCKLQDVLITGQYYIIIFENFNCTLETYLHSLGTNQRLSNGQVRILLHAITQALCFFQSQDFCHGNISAQSICLSDTELTPDVKVKLFDFTISNAQDQTIDIFNLGELLSDHSYPDETLQALLSSMTDPNPSARPNLREITKSPFLNPTTISSDEKQSLKYSCETLETLLYHRDNIIKIDVNIPQQLGALARRTLEKIESTYFRIKQPDPYDIDLDDYKHLKGQPIVDISNLKENCFNLVTQLQQNFAFTDQAKKDAEN